MLVSRKHWEMRCMHAAIGMKQWDLAIKLGLAQMRHVLYSTQRARSTHSRLRLS
eukprot:COSAG06_NODE_6321_length_2984_cov_1.050260_3_plen_54_part_00